MSTRVTLDRVVYVGAFVHSISLRKLEICDAGVIGVDETGKIAFIEKQTRNTDEVLQHHSWNNVKIVHVPKSGFLFPGFVDTHIHASQYPNAGIFGDSTLLDWLQKYTFPLESSLSDLTRARRVYDRVVQRTLSHGTTTAAYYATIHVPATNLLADICLARGQRAFVGRVCMDAMSPDFYKDESPEQAVADTVASIDHIREIDPEYALIKPIVTPRFAPSCTKPCMQKLATLVHRMALPCQTHMSENKSELELVRKLFPEFASYTEIYDKMGLLTDRTVLAHVVHVSEQERELIKARQSGVSHCPVSNTALSSGRAMVKKLLNAGIKVGLGTDVSGGYSPSVLEAARQAIMVSRHIAMEQGDEANLSAEEVLYLATRGGARVLGLDHLIGGFEVGMEWDAQMILCEPVGEELDQENTHTRPVDIFGWESSQDRVAKWLYTGDDRNTVAVWVKGRLVHQTPGCPQ